jgi:hypothetical protein
MNVENLTYLLNNPSELNSQDIEKLEKIKEEFPYFQAVKAIQLKGLFQSNSYKYNKALKKTAAYTIDRKVLFEFITSSSFIQNKLQSNTTINTIQKSSSDNSNSKIEQVKNKVSNKKTDILELGKPIEFISSEPHTFNEWMKLTIQKPIQRGHNTIGNDKLEIINQFLKTNPKIKPVAKQQTSIDISTESASENENLMTETLAKVYLEQKKYAKAIQAYHILSLKYPEKSSFFANQIKAIKILQINKS